MPAADIEIQLQVGKKGIRIEFLDIAAGIIIPLARCRRSRGVPHILMLVAEFSEKG